MDALYQIVENPNSLDVSLMKERGDFTGTVMGVFVFILVVAGIGGLIYMARKKN